MRIGMLTSGGDCQSLNATMRGVAKALYEMYEDVEIIGFEEGYKGLIYADYRMMTPKDFGGILTEARPKPEAAAYGAARLCVENRFL